jgi:hypothetical protein
MKRGLGTHSVAASKEILNLDFFFRYNRRTDEKQLYAERILKDELK